MKKIIIIMMFCIFLVSGCRKVTEDIITGEQLTITSDDALRIDEPEEAILTGVHRLHQK